MADQLLRITAWLAILVAGVVIVGSLLNHFALDDAVPDLDAGQEDSFNNWVSVVATFSAGLAAALHALFFSERQRWFAALAAIFAFLSLDDLTKLHERLGANIGIDHIETVIFAPVFGAAFLIAWALAREVPARVGRFLRGGLILLVAAVVVDLGASYTADLQEEGTDWPQATRIAVEEGFEVAGWIVVSAALITLLCVTLTDTGRSSRRDVHTRR